MWECVSAHVCACVSRSSVQSCLPSGCACAQRRVGLGFCTHVSDTWGVCVCARAHVSDACVMHMCVCTYTCPRHLGFVSVSESQMSGFSVPEVPLHLPIADPLPCSPHSHWS